VSARHEHHGLDGSDGSWVRRCRLVHLELVNRLQRLMPTLGGGDDVLGSGFPGEGHGLLVVVLDEAVDGLLQADQGREGCHA
jgi:hypothetical protein